jgi:hypothetical protein
MAKPNDDFALLLAGAALGAGAALAAAAYLTNEQKRSHFFETLHRELDGRGLRLIAATFGRGSGNRGIWSVTYQTPWSETRVRRVRFDGEVEPYADVVAQQVAAALG